MNEYTNEYANANYEEEINFESNFEVVRETGYSVEFSDTLSESWKLMQRNLGALIGFCVAAFLLIMVGYILLILIPYVGIFLAIPFFSIVIAGFYTFFVNFHIRKFASFSDFFESFKHTLHLGLYGLVSTIISYIPVLFLGGIIALIVYNSDLSGFKALETLKDMENFNEENIDELMRVGMFLFALIFGGLFLITIPTLLISMLFIFAPLIIITQKKNFWTSMQLSRKLVLRNFWGNLGFFFVLLVINYIGSIPFGLGLLITIPLSFACVFVLYIKILRKNGNETDFTFASNFYGDENAPLDAI